MTITQYRKEIVYDRETHDYAYYLDGELMGFARTYHEAETTLDELVYTLLQKQPMTDTCPSCDDPLQDGARLCDAGVEADGSFAARWLKDAEPTPLPLATDMYNVVCLVLSGAAATTAIAELKRVQARYEKEMGR